MDDETPFPLRGFSIFLVIVVAFMIGFGLGDGAGGRADRNLQGEVEAYRDRVNLCATTAENGNQLRTCIKEAKGQWGHAR